MSHLCLEVASTTLPSYRSTAPSKAPADRRDETVDTQHTSHDDRDDGAHDQVRAHDAHRADADTRPGDINYNGPSRCGRFVIAIQEVWACQGSERISMTPMEQMPTPKLRLYSQLENTSHKSNIHQQK